MIQPRTTVFVNGQPREVTGIRLLAQGLLPSGWALLFGSAEGVYFVQRQDPAPFDAHDERTWMEGISPGEAAALFGELGQKAVTYEEAFHG